MFSVYYGELLHLTCFASFLQSNSSDHKLKNETGDVWRMSEKHPDLNTALVLLFTAPGDCILDMCCGTGSLGVAAIENGRGYIGYDSDIEVMKAGLMRFEKVGSRSAG